MTSVKAGHILFYVENWKIGIKTNTLEGGTTMPAGRPTKEKELHRKQLTVTLDPATINKLENACENKKRTTSFYLSRYIDEYVDKIKEII